MATLQRFNNSRVVMYFDDHPPPHVHVKLRDGRECIVELHNLAIKGQIEPREIQEALNWIANSLEFLFKQWRSNNP